jgi:hypothetical protein
MNKPASGGRLKKVVLKSFVSRRMGEMRNTYKILVGKPEGRRPL